MYSYTSTSSEGAAVGSHRLLCQPFFLPSRATRIMDSGAVVDYLKENMADVTGPFGVLLFLYSVVLTKVSHP